MSSEGQGGSLKEYSTEKLHILLCRAIASFEALSEVWYIEILWQKEDILKHMKHL